MLNMTNYRPLVPFLSTQTDLSQLSLESKVTELQLYDFVVDIDELGSKVADVFESHQLLPGVILVEGENLAGMISRRRFLEYISRPYGRELFLRRSIRCLYRFAETEVLSFPKDALIVDVAKASLERSSDVLYEPIIIDLGMKTYRLLDVHQLLVAQSRIHELATKLIRQQTQNQLIQTEKMASLGQMVAGVAHEIRNPVTAITGNVGCLSNYLQDLLDLIDTYSQELPQENTAIELVKERIDWEFLQQDLPEIMQSMKVAGERLSHLTGSLHSFSHLDGTQKKEADIHQCIDSTLLILRGRLKGEIILLKNYANLPMINCYSGQISQVIMNIVANAIDALTEFSPTQKKLITDWQPTIEITTEMLLIDHNNWLSVKISDNGPGIPQEIQDRVFDTFFTTKAVGKGTGLGLAITYQIVTEKHGGKLQLNSVPGKGTEFQVLLPYF